jgi:hypothetical protein
MIEARRGGAVVGPQAVAILRADDRRVTLDLHHRQDQNIG